MSLTQIENNKIENNKIENKDEILFNKSDYNKNNIYLTKYYKLLSYNPDYDKMISPLYGLKNLTFEYVLIILYQYYCILNNIPFNLSDHKKIIVSIFPCSEVFNKDLINLICNQELYNRINFINKNNIFCENDLNDFCYNAGFPICKKRINNLNNICNIYDLNKHFNFINDDIKKYNILKIYNREFYTPNINFEELQESIELFKNQTSLREINYKNIIYNDNKTIKFLGIKITVFLKNLNRIKTFYQYMKKYHKDEYDIINKGEIVDKNDDIIDF